MDFFDEKQELAALAVTFEKSLLQAMPLDSLFALCDELQRVACLPLSHQGRITLSEYNSVWIETCHARKPPTLSGKEPDKLGEEWAGSYCDYEYDSDE